MTRSIASAIFPKNHNPTATWLLVDERAKWQKVIADNNIAVN